VLGPPPAARPLPPSGLAPASGGAMRLGKAHYDLRSADGASACGSLARDEAQALLDAGKVEFVSGRAGAYLRILGRQDDRGEHPGGRWTSASRTVIHNPALTKYDHDRAACSGYGDPAVKPSEWQGDPNHHRHFLPPQEDSLTPGMETRTKAMERRRKERAAAAEIELGRVGREKPKIIRLWLPEPARQQKS
jgi:hypothetical protein